MAPQFLSQGVYGRNNAPGDVNFWWIELKQLPPKAMVDPADWPPPRRTRAVEAGGTVTAPNTLNVRTNTGQVTVWLSPEMVNLKRKVSVIVNGRHVTGESVVPDVKTLLEDVRIRGDRQHPFWAKVESSTGRLASGR